MGGGSLGPPPVPQLLLSTPGNDAPSNVAV